jgi:hypothetical protein
VLQVKTRIPADGEMPLDVPSTGTTSGQLKLIMKTGLPPDALDPGFHYALDPGFHGVPAGPAHPERDADGAGVA